VTTTQWWENILSIFGNSSDTNLQGTKQFRLDWWNKIIGYTFNGPYFWTGKGFGINLADADGFQPTADHSLREPHNTHISLLAREGVPGFLLWILLQGAFALLLLRALLAHRRAGDMQLAAVAAWILAFWAAMMVNTSFDPYLEGPQGGIWFWVLFGLGLVIIRLVPRRQAE
jgi:O-antigen ligase